jgi:hypothetical protein
MILNIPLPTPPNPSSPLSQNKQVDVRVNRHILAMHDKQIKYTKTISSTLVISMDEYSKVFAEYVVNLQYEDLSPEVIEKTKMHFLDTLGNILGAYEMPWSRMVINVVKQMKGDPQSTVVGDGRYSMMNAALANGTMAHGIDADDSGARPSWAHPGSCIIPAAYAAAEDERVDGRQLITALLAGYEVCCRVDSAAYPGPRDRGLSFALPGACGFPGRTPCSGRKPAPYNGSS